jgi:HPt (histidine-containing phosphotransfer) domain-containing protein
MAGAFFDPAAGLALVMDNQAIYETLLRSFVEHHQNLEERINRLIGQNDRSELVRFCHTAKSTTAHVGSTGVQQQARAVELQLKSSPGFLTDVEKHDLASLVQNMRRLIDLAEAYLTAYQSPATAPDAPAVTNTSAVTDQQSGPTSSDDRPPVGPVRDRAVWLQLRHSLDAHDPKTSRRLLNQLLADTVLETDRQILLQVQTLLGQYQYGKACQLLDPILG